MTLLVKCLEAFLVVEEEEGSDVSLRKCICTYTITRTMPE